MQRIMLLIKFGVTGLLALVLIIPLVAISGLTQERQNSSLQVLEDIQRLSVREQTIAGPILAVPFRRTVVTRTTDRLGAVSETSATEEGHLYFLPDSLAIEGDVKTEMRQRGIYSALMFRARQKLDGAFTIPERFGIEPAPNVTYAFRDARVILGISDTRGIKETPTLRWQEAGAEWKGGTETVGLPGGLRADIGSVEPGRRYIYAIGLDLLGAQSLQYVPAGKQTSVAMKSDWPHPSFSGQFLPESRTIDDTGFTAVWRTSHLASNVESALGAGCLQGKCGIAANAAGVTFIQPVNVYLESGRAVKYGFLFIVITFVIFQLFELLKNLQIHPVQYGLVGFALALFFLLLLALTEHVSFGLAYTIASVSCVGLLAFYVSFVLRSARRAAGFTTMLSALYGALYVLLRSEDMALLLGAALLFAILAAVMIVTRRVDWYRIVATEQEKPLTSAE